MYKTKSSLICVQGFFYFSCSGDHAWHEGVATGDALFMCP